MALIEKLSWDSEFFQLRIGRIFTGNGQTLLPEGFIPEARTNFDLVFVISNQILPANIQKNMELADIMITMSQPVPKQEKPSDFQFRTSLSAKELGECYAIAEQTAEVSRFYAEPLIGQEKAKALYRKWIDNSVNQQFADGILIAKTEGTISGIHVVKSIGHEKTGLCSLIGVNSQFKGMGIGRNLWDQAFAYWAKKGSVERCKVPFSIKNSESFNFHLKMGFNKVDEIKYIYHYRNNN